LLYLLLIVLTLAAPLLAVGGLLFAAVRAEQLLCPQGALDGGAGSTTGNAR
jgi:hypothetical protein